MNIELIIIFYFIEQAAFQSGDLFIFDIVSFNRNGLSNQKTPK